MIHRSGPIMELGQFPRADIAVGVDSTSTELGVRDGTATATPTAGGNTISVGAGETARATVDEPGVSVSRCLSAAAGGAMPDLPLELQSDNTIERLSVRSTTAS